jgi:hypothetical protein
MNHASVRLSIYLNIGIIHRRPLVYYRVYDQGGEVASKTSYNETDFSLGRVDALSVPPPHIVSSLRSRLLQAEEANQAVQLFEDDCGETIMNDADAIALSSADYPGINEDEPIAIVYQSDKSASTSEGKIYASPQPSSFSKQIKLLPGCGGLYPIGSGVVHQS